MANLEWRWEDELADNIQCARIESHFSQSEMAARCGLQPSAISHFENARRVPSLKNFHKICEALRVNPDYLLPKPVMLEKGAQ